MKIREYLTEGLSGKPKKNQYILTIHGDKLKIHTNSRGVIYADTGTIERYVTSAGDLIPDPKGGNFWAETMSGKTYYDFK